MSDSTKFPEAVREPALAPPAFHHALEERLMPAYVFVDVDTADGRESKSSEVFCGAVPHTARLSFWSREAMAVSSLAFTRSTTAPGPRFSRTSVYGMVMGWS